MIEYGIRTRLLAVSAVTTLVGGAAASNRQITVGKLPQKPVFPAIVIRVISGVPEYDMEGEAGLHETRLQVDCYAAQNGPSGYDPYDAARQLGEAVQDALSGWYGAAGAYTVEASFLENRHTGYDDTFETHLESIDFRVTWKPTP